MKNISFDCLFESDLTKSVQKKGSSNKLKIESLKNGHINRKTKT